MEPPTAWTSSFSAIILYIASCHLSNSFAQKTENSSFSFFFSTSSAPDLDYSDIFHLVLTFTLFFTAFLCSSDLVQCLRISLHWWVSLQEALWINSISYYSFIRYLNPFSRYFMSFQWSTFAVRRKELTEVLRWFLLILARLQDCRIRSLAFTRLPMRRIETGSFLRLANGVQLAAVFSFTL